MNNKHYVGKQISSFERYDDITITGIALLVDDENEYLAGNDSGYLLEISCPYGTQTMANNLLASLQGKTYRGFRAENASLSPAAELGDGVTVNGVYSLLAYRNVEFGPGHMAEIAAPGEGTLEHEYKWDSPEKRAFNRKIAATRSLISKTAEEIRLEVFGEDGAFSTLSQTVDGLEMEIHGENGAFSSLSQSLAGLAFEVHGEDGSGGLTDRVASVEATLDGITLSVTNGETSSTITLMSGSAEIDSAEIKLTGVVTFDALSSSPGTGQTKINGGWIDADTLHVKAANIDGELNIGLPDDIAYIDDIPTTVSELTNDKGYQTKSGVTNIVEDTVTAGYVNALEISASYLRGQTIGLLASDGTTEVGSITITNASTATYAVELQSDGAMRLLADGTYATLWLEAGQVGAALAIENIGGSGYHVAVTRSLVPHDNGGCYCGTANRVWKGMYTQTAPVVTSDRGKKKNIMYGLDGLDGFFDDLKPSRYQLKDGTSGRAHNGFVAQDIKSSLDKYGISTQDFAGYVADIDENGEETYGLRYGEFIPLLVDQVQKLKARVAKLEGGKTS